MKTTRAALAAAGVTAAAAAALVVGVAAPPAVGFMLAEAPRVYGSVLAWLTPPYLYLIINCIIISIAASSRFQKHSVEHVEAKPEAAASEAVAARYEVPTGYVVAASEAVAARYEVPAGYVVAAKEEEDVVPQYDVPAAYLLAKNEVDREGYEVTAEYGGLEEEKKPVEHGALALYDGKENKADEGYGEEEFVIARSSYTPRRRGGESRGMLTEYSHNAKEKPLVSVRFGHRRSAKPSPDGKALGVAAGRTKRNETLENTWRTITDGRPVPLTRHLRKSDTWAVREDPQPAVPATSALMHKSETFSEGARASPGSGAGGGRLRKEPSLGQDDLNRRVEAFINKFNEEMRLQRQESFKHYVDMINRGSQ